MNRLGTDVFCLDIEEKNGYNKKEGSEAENRSERLIKNMDQ